MFWVFFGKGTQFVLIFSSWNKFKMIFLIPKSDNINYKMLSYAKCFGKQKNFFLYHLIQICSWTKIKINLKMEATELISLFEFLPDRSWIKNITYTLFKSECSQFKYNLLNLFSLYVLPNLLQKEYFL